MYGVDNRYAVVTAFVMGCHEASGRRLLNGFEEWLLETHRPGTPSSLGWHGSLVDLADPSLRARVPGDKSYRHLGEDESAALTKFMFDELDRFLESRIVAGDDAQP